MEVDKRYKVNSVRVQTYSAAKIQTQNFVLQCNFPVRHRLS